MPVVMPRGKRCTEEGFLGPQHLVQFPLPPDTWDYFVAKCKKKHCSRAMGMREAMKKWLGASREQREGWRRQALLDIPGPARHSSLPAPLWDVVAQRAIDTGMTMVQVAREAVIGWLETTPEEDREALRELGLLEGGGS